MAEVPVIDISPLLAAGGESNPALAKVAESIDGACRDTGFFTIVGHGVSPELRERLDHLARHFFSQPEDAKLEIEMARGRRAWRGWFPVGGELTAGVPDLKEGLYFGAELGAEDRRVLAGMPMHGANLFPREPEALRPVVLQYLDELTRVGQVVLRGIALGLGLEPSWFVDHLTNDPLILFRIFHYPGGMDAEPDRWGVAEHTDYGLLTILGQDEAGGLQVHSPHDGWIDIEPRADAFVCNLGDMLERLTGGLYLSTPHRVRNASGVSRLSFPFFLDPSWDAKVERLPIVDRPANERAAERWDHASVHGFEGTYGEYILGKVGRVFPALAADASSESGVDGAAGVDVGQLPDGFVRPA